METIVKIFTNKYIDLTKIVAISHARFINRMGSGGFFVGFEIYCQLLEQPLKYERHVPYNQSKGKEILMVNGTFEEPYFRNDYDTSIQAVADLQKEIDVIVRQWKQIKGE